MNGVPEYDLLLQPGADLSEVVVHVEGARGLSIATDGSLVIETRARPVDPAGAQDLGGGPCGEEARGDLQLHAARRGPVRVYGAGWDGDTHLTIDPGLIWSTFLGGSDIGRSTAHALSVDASGVVTVAGGLPRPPTSRRPAAPTTRPTTAGRRRLRQPPGSEQDRNGAARLLHLLGGKWRRQGHALSVDASGVVTVAGDTFPPTSRRPAAPTTRPTTAGQRHGTSSSAAWIRARPEPRSSSTPPSWGEVATSTTPPTRSPSTPAAW